MNYLKILNHKKPVVQKSNRILRAVRVQHFGGPAAAHVRGVAPYGPYGLLEISQDSSASAELRNSPATVPPPHWLPHGFASRL